MRNVITIGCLAALLMLFANSCSTNQGSKQNQVRKKTDYKVIEPEAIDLGLSVKWGNFFLGQESPDDIYENDRIYFPNCFLYQWGNLQPDVAVRDAYYSDDYMRLLKVDYEQPENRFLETNRKDKDGFDLPNRWTKYTEEDGKKVLDLCDDAAHVALGGKWRMPTEEEANELLRKCSWEIVTKKNLQYWRCTGPNGNKIYFAGAHNGPVLLQFHNEQLIQVEVGFATSTVDIYKDNIKDFEGNYIRNCCKCVILFKKLETGGRRTLYPILPVQDK